MNISVKGLSFLWNTISNRSFKKPSKVGSEINSDITAEKIIDSSFLAVYAITLVVLMTQAYKSLKNKENRTFHIILTISLIVSTLLCTVFIQLIVIVRIWALIYFLYNAEFLLDYSSYTSDNLWKICFYFELPFELIISASIV
jgi:chromate transport protein ChrA